jgi:hypothetical protein
MALVLHCAGPFSATARPMIEACLDSGAHYLDITGEIAVFELAHSLDARARHAGVLLCPGVGFDVVPTDCLAATLKPALPDADRLALGFDSRGGMSPGTARTSVEGLASGGRARRGGRLGDGAAGLAHAAHRFRRRREAGDDHPWGDIATAWQSTGIPDIEVYLSASPRLVARLRRLNWIRPALVAGAGAGLAEGQDRPDRARTGRRPAGADADLRVGRGGQCPRYDRHGTDQVANGYDVTVHAALGIAARVLEMEGASGHQTPVQLVGPGLRGAAARFGANTISTEAGGDRLSRIMEFAPPGLIANPHLQSILPSSPPGAACCVSQAAPLAAVSRSLLLDCGEGVRLHGWYAPAGGREPRGASPC